MTRKKLTAFILCSLLLMLTACQNGAAENSAAGSSDDVISSTSVSDMSISEADASNEDEEPNTYMGYTNFVKKNVSGEYIPIIDELEYNGGEFDIDLEFLFDGSGKKADFADALAMFFVDGYMQEFSLEGSEKALVHKITIQNHAMIHINYKSVLATYDDSSDKHTICAVILPYWQMGSEDFIKDTVVMAITREIKLNTINKPQENNVVNMSTREKTGWDSSHSELPYKRGESDTDLTFHCLKEGETCCYVFCGGELLSQNGKYIFASKNTSPETVSFQDISVDKSDVGKPLYVLYIPKSVDDPLIERTCNYIWKKSE